MINGLMKYLFDKADITTKLYIMSSVHVVLHQIRIDCIRLQHKIFFKVKLKNWCLI